MLEAQFLGGLTELFQLSLFDDKWSHTYYFTEKYPTTGHLPGIVDYVQCCPGKTDW